mmetsp:Transcript_8249/g.17846  ORF Transcript_8249/g.17846 Transcript_8249/m.17846 type:complete len:83 (-) Transcript_8249:174-422(-)
MLLLPPLAIVVIGIGYDGTNDGNLLLNHGHKGACGAIGSRGIVNAIEVLGGKGHVDEFEDGPEEDSKEDGDDRGGFGEDAEG